MCRASGGCDSWVLAAALLTPAAAPASSGMPGTGWNSARGDCDNCDRRLVNASLTKQLFTPQRHRMLTAADRGPGQPCSREAIGGVDVRVIGPLARSDTQCLFSAVDCD